MPLHQPRILFFDDNIRGTGGHFLELATLLISGSQELGYAPTLIANREFNQTKLDEVDCPVIPAFRQRRLVRWSLGVDGMSRARRNSDGKPIDSRWLKVKRQQVRDLLVRPDRHPRRMLQEYADDLERVFRQLRVTSNDILMLNTSDDFSLLGLAQAIQIGRPATPLNVHALFHFAIHEKKQRDAYKRSVLFAQQVNETIQQVLPHQVHLHATTDPLTHQMIQSGVESIVNSVPYPTRPRKINRDRQPEGRAKVVLAGLPRQEKGRAAMSGLLRELAPSLIEEYVHCLSMQMPVNRWQSMIPDSMRAFYEAALARPLNLDPTERPTEPIEVLTADLDTETYHGWLDTADIGLFLYEPHRYVARCSGVLLEMLARGVPVLVPDHCWLADYVRRMSGSRPCGLIYQNRATIPGDLHEIAKNYSLYRNSAIGAAQRIANDHTGANALAMMGIKDQMRWSATPTQTQQPLRRKAG